MYASVILSVFGYLNMAVSSPDLTEMMVLGFDGKYHAIDLEEYVSKSATVVEEEDIIFEVFTRENVSVYRSANYQGLMSQNFNKSRSTKIVIHGWMSNAQVYYDLKDAFLKKKDLNVIIMEWPSRDSYLVARGKVLEVGRILAGFLSFLFNEDVDMTKVHIIGHSLGAHVAGIAAKRMPFGKIGRITGLDPAAPAFWLTRKEDRLFKTDALYVEAIHTCSGFLGWLGNIGQVDIYPNGGTMIQPGCGADLGGACSHIRSRELFTDGIRNDGKLLATQCNSFEDYVGGKCEGRDSILLGMDIPNPRKIKSRGSYYLTTGDSPPFALGLTERNHQ